MNNKDTFFIIIFFIIILFMYYLLCEINNLKNIQKEKFIKQKIYLLPKVLKI